MTATTGLEPLLAAEHAAIYGYGVAGAVLVKVQASSDMLGATRSGFDAHRELRDQLTDAIAAAGGTAPVPAAAYRLPSQLTDAASALRLLAVLEDRVSAVAIYAVAHTTGTARGTCANEVSNCAIRGARLRLLLGLPAPAIALAFPGLPAA